jgi:uncharacterized damage-inducible protein DinB
MPLSDALLAELDHEMATTRRVLERVPEGKLSWKPHMKSMSLGQLATHIAETAEWTESILGSDSFDIKPKGAPPYTPREDKTRDAILRRFDESVKQARAAIAAVSDAQWMKPWTLLKTGATIFTMPKLGVIRSMILNHIVHHRGQLTVYLRLNDVPLPQVYGPTADEGM